MSEPFEDATFILGHDSNTCYSEPVESSKQLLQSFVAPVQKDKFLGLN